jgi:hypothetical protein
MGHNARRVLQIGVSRRTAAKQITWTVGDIWADRPLACFPNQRLCSPPPPLTQIRGKPGRAAESNTGAMDVLIGEQGTQSDEEKCREGI